MRQLTPKKSSVKNVAPATPALAPVVQEERTGKEVLWIYPGERRPIIVLADGKEQAKEKVRKSPEYDGFPIYVYTVEEFALRCLPAEERVGKNAVSMKPGIASMNLPSTAFVLTKVVDGKVQEAFISPSEEKAIKEGLKIKEHLSEKAGDSIVMHKVSLEHFSMGEDGLDKLLKVELKEKVAEAKPVEAKAVKVEEKVKPEGPIPSANYIDMLKKQLTDSNDPQNY